MVHVKQGMITLIYYSYIWRWEMRVTDFFLGAQHSTLSLPVVPLFTATLTVDCFIIIPHFSRTHTTRVLSSSPLAHLPWGGFSITLQGEGDVHTVGLVYICRTSCWICSPSMAAHKLLVWRTGNFASFHCSTSFPGTNDVSIVDSWGYVNSI